MQTKAKQEGKLKSYQLRLHPDDSKIFDQFLQQQGLPAGSYLRMLVKREIAVFTDSKKAV